MAEPRSSLLRRRRRPVRAAAITLCGLLALSAPAVSAPAATVQAVDVRLEVEGGGPSGPVRARLLETVERVAQRLLLGRQVDNTLPTRTQLEAALATVVDGVVTGYAVGAASLRVGPTTVVAMRLRPEAPVIRAVTVAPRVALHPAVAPLVLQPAERALVPAVRGLLLGLPVAALDWAAPLVADEVRRVAEETVVGFTVGVTVQPAAHSRIEITLMPRDTRVIRDIGVRFRSFSIPHLLLEQHAPQIISLAEPIRGLPVVFAEQQRPALESLIAERLHAYPPAAHYRIVARPVLRVGETTYVTIVADSALYLGRLEAVLNVGSRAPNAELRIHLGRLFGDVELFGEASIVPNTLSGRYDVGARYRLSDTLDLGTNVALNAISVTGWTTYRLSADLGIRAAYEIHGRTFEGSVRYRINEVLSGEVVGTSRGEYWLRLISNL